MSIDKSASEKRRRLRKDYITKEPPEYFHQKVWPEMLKREQLAKNHKDVTVLTPIQHLMVDKYIRKLFS